MFVNIPAAGVVVEAVAAVELPKVGAPPPFPNENPPPGGLLDGVELPNPPPNMVLKYKIIEIKPDVNQTPAELTSS